MTPQDIEVLDLTEEIHDNIDRLLDAPIQRRAEYGGEANWLLQNARRDAVNGDQDETIRACRKRLLIECLNVSPAQAERFA